MEDIRNRSSQAPLVRIASLLGLLGLVASSMLTGKGDAQARIHPYHVVRSGAVTNGPVRILVLVDTSGSMADASDGSGACPFAECEDEDSPRMSKIAAARLAVRKVAESTQGVAEFGFLGFTRPAAPTKSQEIPAMCSGKRFRWVTQYQSTQGGTATLAANLHGYSGVWELCGIQKPFPYLRWDNLGVGSVIAADLQTGALPTSPLIAVDQASYGNAINASRKVQWFPTFEGVRVNPSAALAGTTYGDYTSAEVSGSDFYYWPYVDGFPGYTDFLGSAGGRMGVAAQQNDSLELYGPFYIDVDPALLNPSYVGPSSVADARESLLKIVSPMTEGGIDVDGGAFNWENVIGSLPNAPLSQNSIFSSTDLARYLQFHDLATEAAGETCYETRVVLITDGEDSNTAKANYRMAAIAKELGIGAFVIGVGPSVPSSLNNLACAATGACDGSANSCDTPCDDVSTLAWNTCADPSNPATSCAWSAASADGLAATLTEIVNKVVELDVDPGPGATISDFGVGSGDDETDVQTGLSAYTEAPAWKGHLIRGYCDHTDGAGNLRAYCRPPSPEFEQPEETFGPCPQSRAWDAGSCLQATAWTDRRLYTHDENNDLVAIAEADGSATDAFRTQLSGLGIISGMDLQEQADEVAAFVLGRDAPGGWKLPGLANSSPIVVRRVPPYEAEQMPEVAIRDPHCAGRQYGVTDFGGLPQSLYDFAEAVWDPDALIDQPSPHYAYQEAVLIGDDMGVLHAFQLDSGNELWGLVPRAVLAGLERQADIGAETRGQPSAIDEHIFGIAATVNQGWVHDPGIDGTPGTPDDTWRHLGVFGLGGGGAEFVALDLSHMSPESPDGPFEILWTSDDAAVKDQYDAFNGETWARPALTYTVAGNDLANPPEAFLVLGSGYQTGEAPAAQQGRTMVRASALTGEVLETAVLPSVSHSVYESDFGAVVDSAVASHCLSRFWSEMQETYIADPAGRLFRWDLGGDAGSHAADSGSVWGDGGTATPVATFRACTGAGDTCTVSGTNPGDVFVFAPAVTANDRIDDDAAGQPPTESDQFLVALVSGSSFEDTIDGFATGLDFHSSIYLLVDDHSSDPSGGFSIPAGAPKSTGGTVGAGADLSNGQSGYLRIPLTDIQRTRTVTPYAGADEVSNTRNFSRQTRPVRAPRIMVTGAATQGDDDVLTAVEGIEVASIQFAVYEPPPDICDEDFYEAATDTWHDDRGSTFIVTFRLTSDAASGFNFNAGAENGAVDFGDGFTRGLTLESVDQVEGDACPSGSCGPQASALGGFTTCDNNKRVGAGLGGASKYAVPMRTTTLSGFTPYE